jgi:hypothetical protein
MFPVAYANLDDVSSRNFARAENPLVFRVVGGVSDANTLSPSLCRYQG